MTSQKSSPRSDRRAFSPFLYTFSRAFSENFIFPLLNAAWITFMVPVMTLTTLILPMLHDTTQDSPKLADQFKYILLSDSSSTMSMFLILGVCLFSGLTGVFLFRFMSAKKTVNVYYSLGIKRRSLFLAKYAAGAIMLAVSIVIPMLVSAFINIHYLGSSVELWRAVFYYMLALYLVAMICMTVTAAVFSAVGTLLEGMGFSAVILLLPTILIQCVNILMSVVLWGNPYTAGGFYNGDGNIYISVQSLTELTKSYNPILFPLDTINNIAAMSADGKTNPILSMYAGETSFTPPNFWALLPWAAVIAVCLGIALFVFQRRKAEICGFLGRNWVLNFIIELTLGFGVFTAAIDFLYDRLNHALAVLIAAALYLVLYVIVEAILTRSGRLLLRGLWKLPIHLAIALIIYGIFATGLFGYSTRIPAVSEIKEVYIDADYDLSVYDISPSCYVRDGYAIIDSSNTTLGGFTTENDKKLITEIHQKLIDSRKESDDSQKTARAISIRYVLNDGSNLMRNYDITTNDTLYETLRLYESDWSREKMRETISADPEMPEISEENKTELGSEMVWDGGSFTEVYYGGEGEVIPENSKYGYQTGSVLLSNGFAQTELPLTQEQHTALKRAVIADVTTMTAKQKFQPDTVATYTLIFCSKLETSPNDLNIGIPCADYDQTPYPLTDGMMNTLNFLRENGLLDLLQADTASPDSVIIRPVGTLLNQNIYYNSNWGYGSRMFYNVTIDATPEYEDISVNAPETALTPEQFTSLRPHLYQYYYTRGTGYVVNATYKEADVVITYYLPTEFAPESVKAQLGA